jgi:hypothetical protein
MRFLKSTLTFLARAIAVLCAIVVVAGLIAAVLVFNIERNLFTAETYRRAFAEANLYEQMPVVIAQQFVAGGLPNPCTGNPLMCQIENAAPELQACLKMALGTEAYDQLQQNIRHASEAEQQSVQPCFDRYGAPPIDSGAGSEALSFAKFLTVKDWELLITTILPPQELEQFTNDTLDAIFAFLNNDSDNITISTVWLKERIRTHGLDALLQIMRAQPPCTPEQLVEFATTLSDPKPGSLLSCNPPEEVVQTIMPTLQAMLDQTVAGMPNEFVPIQAMETAPGQPSPRESVQMVRLIMRLTPLLPLAALLGVTIFAVRSLRGWLLWWGVPLTIGGLLTFLSGLALSPLAGLVLVNFVQPEIPSYYAAEFVTLMINTGMAVMASVAKPVIFQSLVLSLIAVAMLIASAFVPRAVKTEGCVP